jgi:hypothetical protein
MSARAGHLPALGEDMLDLDGQMGDLGGHLAVLGDLRDLTVLGVTSADFYSHSFFSVLRAGSSFV